MQPYYLDIDQTNYPILIIPPLNFPNSVVKVDIHVKVGPYPGIDNNDTKYIRIIPTPLVVKLIGDKTRQASNKKPFNINAEGN